MSIQPTIQPTIQLTTREQELFDLLLEVVTHYNRKTVLRVAGGWVRDKLLQKQSHDIDIALDDVSGIEFANLVNEFLTHRGMETRTIALIQVSYLHLISLCSI
jgi:tRNA nucleotidyltransferase/poly(A) polymerase